MKFKVGDKVRVRSDLLIGGRYSMENDNLFVPYQWDKRKAKASGRVVTIKTVLPYKYPVEEFGDLCFTDGMFEGLVEDKKVFTKSDLKSGMFGYFDNETDDWFVIVGDRFIYQKGLGDYVIKLNDNLEMPSGRKITALYSAICFDHATKFMGNLIWKREEKKPEPKPLYNGKVVCIDNTGNLSAYTVGKIYQFKDGVLTNDRGTKYREINPVTSFEDWVDWTSSKFIEIKE